MEPKEYVFTSTKPLQIGKNYQVKEFLTTDGVKGLQIEIHYVKGRGMVVSSGLHSSVAA